MILCDSLGFIYLGFIAWELYIHESPLDARAIKNQFKSGSSSSQRLAGDAHNLISYSRVFTKEDSSINLAVRF